MHRGTWKSQMHEVYWTFRLFRLQGWTMWLEFVCPANQHPKSKIKKKKSPRTVVHLVNFSKNVSAMFDNPALIITQAPRPRVLEWARFVFVSLRADFALWTLIGSWFDHVFFAFDHVWRKAHSGQFLKKKEDVGEPYLPSLALWTVCWNAHITYKCICCLR